VLTNLWRQSYLSYKALFSWLNWTAYASNVLLRPALMATMFGLIGRFARDEQAAVSYVIGMSAFSMMNIVLAGVLQSFSGERGYGTLGVLFTSSGSRLQSFLTRSVLHYPNGLLNIAAGLGWAAVVLSMSFEGANWPAVAGGFLVLTLSATLFSLFLGNFAIVHRAWNFFMALTTAIWMVFTGVVIPRDHLPEGLYEVSLLLPMTHALEGIRRAFAGASLPAIQNQLALELLVGLGYGVVGYVLFRLVEVHARRSGAYEMTR
jgi:ABC-2 type transport system permease protein